MSDCVRCGRPVHDTAWICGQCGRALRLALIDVMRVAGQHAITITRQSRSNTGTARNATRPLPYSWEAADAAWAVANTLTTWARHVSEERGVPLILPMRTHPMAWVAGWLIGHVDWLRHRVEAFDGFDELHDAARLAVRTVDNPPVRVFLGPCGAERETDGIIWECTSDLYAIPGAALVRCRDCDAEHDAAGRREWLLSVAEDTLGTATHVAGALTAWGYPVRSVTVRKWASRGRLVAHGKDPHGWPLYRLGEVWDLAEDQARRAALTAV